MHLADRKAMSKYDESVDSILDIEQNNIAEAKKSLNRDTIAQIIDLMLTVKPERKKVITAGCGTSGTLAQRVAHTLCVVEVPSAFCSPANAVHGGMGLIQKGDIVILFSKSGNTVEILNFIPCCKQKQATIIGVTQNDDSILAKEADIPFRIETVRESDMWDMCASASCNLVAAVWDAIAFTVMKHSGYTKEDLRLIHPGGRVGELLKEENSGKGNRL